MSPLIEAGPTASVMQMGDERRLVDPGEAVAEPDLRRRGLAGLLGLFGAGAAAKACYSGGDSLDPAESLVSAATNTGFLWADTAVELRSNPGSSATRAAIAAGAREKNDGGGGLFAWFPGITVDDSGIQFAATGGAWVRIFSGPINVRWFGNLVTGAPPGNPDDGDWTDAVLQAVSIVGERGAVYFPKGTYTVKKTVLIESTGRSGIHIFGDGEDATRVRFDPTCATADGGTGPCPTQTPLFHFKGGDIAADRLKHCSLRNMAFAGTAASVVTPKVAVQLTNTDNFLLENIHIPSGDTGYWYSSVSAPTIGVKIIAGQAHKIRRIFVYADIPILIDPPDTVEENTTLNLDMCHLSDLSLSVQRSTEAAIRINQGVYVTNLLIDGQNSFNGGSYGIDWDAVMPEATTGTYHYNITVANIRCEQMATGVSGYAIRIRGGVHEGNHAFIRRVQVDNVRGPGYPGHIGGIHLKKVVGARLENCYLHTNSSATGSSAPAGARPVFTEECTDIECFSVDVDDHATATNTNNALGARFIRRTEGTALNLMGYAYPLPGLKANQFSNGSGTVTVIVRSTTGIFESGTWSFQATSTTTGSTKLVSGTANTADADTSGKFSVEFIAGGVWLRNRMAADVTYFATYEYTT